MSAERSAWPLGTVAIGAAAAVCAWFAVAGDALVGERVALAHGEWWRLWTAHLVHFSGGHLWWSGLVWLVAGAWMEREDRRGWCWAVGVGAPLVTLAALAGDPEIARYGGLSGLACIPVTWAAGLLWRSGDAARRVAGAGVFALLAGKVVAEWMSGGALLARFGAEAGEVRPALWAHVAGAAAGLVSGARAGLRGATGGGEVRA
jgi:membrane associated rhomboid family serine protease